MSDIDSSEVLGIEDEDSVVRKAVDRAVAPWVGLVTPEYLSCMRAALADMLMSHPATEQLVRSLKERSAQQASGQTPIEGTAGLVAGESAPAKRVAGSGQ